MEYLKPLFDGKALTFEEFVQKVTASDSTIKLANLRDGGYVDKEKFAKLETEFKEKATAYDNLVKETGDKDKSYADLQQKLEKLNGDFDTMKKEKEKSERVGVMSKKGVKEEFNDFVYYNVSNMVNESTTFDSALEAYAKKNPQYFESKGSGGAGSIVKFSSGFKSGEKGSIEKANTNNEINAAIREALGRQ